MARTLTVNDAYQIMNLVVKQATGQENIAVTDLSSFVSAGEKVLSTGMENVFNSLSLVLNRTLISARPYKGKLTLMNEVNTDAYSSRVRKISFYSKNALPSGEFNTNLFTNLTEGFTAGQNKDADGNAQSTKSQWEQNQPIALEMNFAGQSTWQACITMYENAIKTAFRGPEDFNAFVAGYLTEHANDIESQKEAWNRMNLLNKIASVYDMSADMPSSVVNLTSAFNTKFGTSYTSEDLRTTYLKEFLAFFVAKFKEDSSHLTERSLNYHWSPAKNVGGVDYNLLRHTPFNRQHVYLFEDFFIEAQANVLPTIFNPEYLDIKTQYEPVGYWQSQNSRASINVTPAVVDTTTGLQKAGNPVYIPFVVGMITDRDGLMTNFGLESVRTTPVEARKGYRNTWNTFLKNNICDNTENCIIYIMEDETEVPEA